MGCVYLLGWRWVRIWLWLLVLYLQIANITASIVHGGMGHPSSRPYSPFSVLIPPQGVLSIYLASTSDFEAAIFPVYVTNYQPAILTGSSPSRTRAHKIQGRLIVANPTSGCALDKLPKIPTGEGAIMQDWILLVDNLGCDTSTKVANAAAKGFQALLVYNTNSDYDPTLLSVDEPSKGLYAASIGDRDGLLLRSLYAYPQEFYLELQETTFVFIDVLYHLMLLCFTITSVFVGLLCASWIYDACQCQKCVERLDERRKERLLHAFLAKKTLTRAWSADGPFQNNDSCIICLEEFTGTDQIRVLPCLHVFHVQCIDVWMLRMSMCCPICKQWIGTKVEEMQVLGDGGEASGDTGGYNQGNAYGYSYYGGRGDEESVPLLPVGVGASTSEMPSHSWPGSSQAAERVPSDSSEPATATARSSMEALRATSASVCALLPTHSTSSPTPTSYDYE